jgi:hypothetical protein
MKQPDAPGNTAVDAIMVTAICFGWFILGSIQAVASGFPTRPFSEVRSVRIGAREVLLQRFIGARRIPYGAIIRIDLA